MREGVDGAGCRLAAGRVEQVARALHGVVNEKRVMREEREHDREYCSPVILLRSPEIENQWRTVDDEVIREVRKVERLREDQVRKSSRELDTRLATENCFFPAQNGGIEIISIPHRGIEQGELGVEERDQQ